jgi:hypothetical protein
LEPRISALARRKIEGALEVPNPTSLTGWRVGIDGQDYSRRLISLTYQAEGAEGENPALTVEASFAGGLPRSIEGAEIYVELIINGAIYKDFSGFVLKPEYRPATTEVQGASGGFFLEHTKLNAPTSYLGLPPSEVVRDVLDRCDFYKGYEIPPVPAPLFQRAGPDAYEDTQSLSDVLGDVREEAQLTVWDDGENWAVAHQRDALKIPGDIVFELEVGRDIHPDDFSVSAEPVKYSDVRVYRTQESGEVEWLIGSETVPAVPVDHTGDPHPPSANISYHIELSDTSPQAAAEATKLAYQKAEALSLGEHRMEFTTRYIHPFALRGSTGLVTQHVEDDDGEWIRRWLVILDTHGRELPAKKGTAGGVATILMETRKPDPVLPAQSGSVSEGVSQKGWGLNLGGAYVNEELPWVYLAHTYPDEDLYPSEDLYPADSAGKVWVNADSVPSYPSANSYPTADSYPFYSSNYGVNITEEGTNKVRITDG